MIVGSGPSAYSALEHRWRIFADAAARVEFHVEGFRTTSTDGDDFRFEWSPDGTTWTPIPLSSLTSLDDDIDVSATLPAQGDLWFRVVDTDRTGGHTGLDTITIDTIWFRVAL